MKPRRPSHLQKIARCEMRWLLDADEETPAMRFGTAVHAVFEAYYHGAQDPPRVAAAALGDGHPCYKSLKQAGWRAPAGKCAMSGLSKLPRPDRCKQIIIEAPAIIPGEPPIQGTRDLLVELEPREQKRLAVATPWLVVDYKTSSNPQLYAKTPQTLRGDAQGVIYPYSAMLDQGLDRIACRWLYLPSRSPHLNAVPTDFIQRRARIERLNLPVIRERARRTLTIVRDPAQAQRNPEACHDYNRLCPNHVDAGGVCNPTGDIDMPKLLDRVKAARAVEPQDEPEVIETEGEEAEEPAPKKKFDAVKKAPKKTAAKAEPADDHDPLVRGPGPSEPTGTCFEATIHNAFSGERGVIEVTLHVPQGAIVPVGAKVRVTA